MMEQWSPGDGVDRVLMVTAHPDDVDFGAGGTVAAFTDAGVEVAYCVVTDGQAGGSDPTITRDAMGALRREEQRAAAAVVGVRDVTFLGYQDGQLAAGIDLRRDIARVIRRFRPQRVVAQSPERNWERIFASHPDHMAAGEATACAVYPDARNPFAFPELLDEGLEPHTVPELWLMAPEHPSVVVDTTHTFDRKVMALQCHRTQVGDGEHIAALVGEWASGVARAAGLADGRRAESFRIVRTA